LRIKLREDGAREGREMEKLYRTLRPRQIQKLWRVREVSIFNKDLPFSLIDRPVQTMFSIPDKVALMGIPVLVMAWYSIL